MSRALQGLLAALVLAALGAGVWASRRAAAQRTAERLLGGERLYRQGLLPSGSPVQAVVSADLEVEGATAACVSCHLRSGAGSLEGRLRSPPITGAVLFADAPSTFKGHQVIGAPPRRPAYTLATLATALRTGVDPASRTLNAAMPRYQLGDDEVALVAEYLQALSPRASPGVDEQALHLATVVSADAPAVEREAMLFALQKYVANKNAQTQPATQGLDNRSARMAKNMLQASLSVDVAFRELALEVWEVSGPPATWRAQLDQAFERRPVFALVGGLVSGPWAPVAAFADAHRLPCLFPISELPEADADADSWTSYLSGGAPVEGEALARHLGDQPGMVQLVAPDLLSRARADGFDRARQALGLPPAPRVEAPAPGAVAVLWDGPGETARLEALAAVEPRVAIHASAVALGPGRRTLSARARERATFTWPRRATGPEAAYAETLRPWLKDAGTGPLDPTSRAYAVAASAYAAIDLFSSALMDLRGHYTGDALLDVLGMMKDQRLPAFERLSFGQGQRLASKGVFLVKVGEDGELVPCSEWLTH